MKHIEKPRLSKFKMSLLAFITILKLNIGYIQNKHRCFSFTLLPSSVVSSHIQETPRALVHNTHRLNPGSQMW